MKETNKWLFNSTGLPIAFVQNNDVFTPEGKFIGEVIKNEVFNGKYAGEIVDDDRLYFNPLKADKFDWHLSLPSMPYIPKTPYSKYFAYLPAGLKDFETAQ